MNHTTAQADVESSIRLLAALEHLQESMLMDCVSMESSSRSLDYLYVRQLRQLETDLGMEALDFQGVKDLFSALGRGSVAMGHGFMKFLEALHRTIDTTHLVRAKQLRAQFKQIPKEDAIDKGRMERPKIAAGLAIKGEITGLLSTAGELTDFSRRTATNVLPELAGMTRRIASRLEAKRWMGNDAFNEEVLEIATILGSQKLPVERYQDRDTQRLWPGNRTIFKSVRIKRPRREPDQSNAAIRKVIQAVSTTDIGLKMDADAVSGKADAILPILTPDQAIELIDAAVKVLEEAVRVKQAVKAYAKDKVPSMFSMMISGFFHSAARTFDDMFTAKDDGYHVVDMSGGQATRHDPGTRKTLGVKASMLSLEEPSLENQKDEQRVQTAVWVSRYLKLTLIDHHKTSQALLLLLVGVARSYLDYAEESLRYYRR